MDLQQMFESMVERNSYRMAVGDYLNEETGTMMCGKCFTPKECRVTSPFDGSVKIVGCLCKCAADKMRAEGSIR